MIDPVQDTHTMNPPIVVDKERAVQAVALIARDKQLSTAERSRFTINHFAVTMTTVTT